MHRLQMLFRVPLSFWNSSALTPLCQAAPEICVRNPGPGPGLSRDLRLADQQRRGPARQLRASGLETRGPIRSAVHGPAAFLNDVGPKSRELGSYSNLSPCAPKGGPSPGPQLSPALPHPSLTYLSQAGGSFCILSTRRTCKGPRNVGVEFLLPVKFLPSL